VNDALCCFCVIIELLVVHMLMLGDAIDFVIMIIMKYFL